ncbi:zinc ABC transporter substrate-binding protein [Methanonatronarchaeum sp. AMET-Sl]|uniref:metal ABC transporter solute-binding protein, Zn/Mn family n=1 Tax=Methanonatronarchaeum sp. AMET-Sl TaxID=3037654 RepID=UPI00244E59B3|nr:zinc ABC transporter substrate-binding protein [Methanonatronarchaeum sp. AMET-Sl]WGI17555.1 zinc ABC transporter substrate-binding protein [Methanonatronarchaeum sp. AMET-Sl]
MKIQKKTTLITILIFIMILVGGTLALTSDQILQQDKEINIAVSIPPQEEIVQKIGGDKIQTTTMVPEGEDPHTYDPTTQRLQEVSEADIYFKVGSGLEFEERHMDTIIEYNKDMKIVDGSQDIQLIDMEDHECPHDHDHDHHNDDSNGLSTHDIEHACLHMEHDERIDIDIGQLENPTIISDTHQPYEIDLSDQTGYIAFETDQTQKYAFFTDKKDKIDFIGNEPTHINEVEECNYIAEYQTIELEPGENIIELDGQGIDNLTVLVEEVDQDEQNGYMDPHIWLSPNNTIQMTNNILEAMIEVNPENSDIYKENADQYISELQEIDQEIETGLAELDDRKFMIYHPSLGYFADRYNLSQIAIEEKGEDPGTQQLKNIIDQAKDEGINTIFVSPQFSQDAATSIAEEIDGEVKTLNPLDKDLKDNINNIYNQLKETLE